MTGPTTSDSKTMRHRQPLGFPAAFALFLGALVVLPGWVGAQTPSATSLEMRHFWHVFVAYAVAWVIIAGWLWSIVRRLRRTEERLSRLDGSGGPA